MNRHMDVNMDTLKMNILALRTETTKQEKNGICRNISLIMRVDKYELSENIPIYIVNKPVRAIR
jgi:hypothetical protein